MKKYTVSGIRDDRLRELLSEFDAAAMAHAWGVDQGWCPETPSEEADRYFAAENKLVEYLYSKGLK